MALTEVAFAQAPPTALTIVSGDGQSAAVRGNFPQPLRVRLTDLEGEPISTAPVLFSAPTTGPGLRSPFVAAVTNSEGIASLNATANEFIGPYMVTVSYSGASPLTFFLLNVAAEPGSITATAGTPQSTEVGSVFKNRLEVVVRDQFGNAVPGVSVTFSFVRTGNAQPLFPEGNTATSDSEGKASLLVKANSSSGTYTITARSGDATPAPFQLTNTPRIVTLYAPALTSGIANQLGIAWTNPLDKPVSLTLTARSYTGQIISGSGIQNPAIVTVPARGQLARQASEIFGAGIVDIPGWVEVAPSDPGSSGVFLLFNSQLSTVDGGSLVDRSSPRLIFPQVNKDTVLHVVNTSTLPIRPASVVMFATNGSQVGNTFLNLDPRSGWTGRITDLIPAAAGAEGYVVFDTQGGPFASRASTLVGLSSYQLGGDSAVVIGQDDASALSTAYAVHVAFGGGYNSRLKLVNLSTSTQNVFVTFNGASVQRTIPASGRLDESLDVMFSLPANSNVSGPLRVQATSDSGLILGYVEISAANGRLLTAEYFPTESELQHVFSHVANGAGYWTGLAIYNPDTSQATVTIEVISTTGSVVASRTVVIGPDVRLVGLLSDLVPGLATQVGGSIRITANRAIYTFEVFSSSEGANFIASVPVSIY